MHALDPGKNVKYPRQFSADFAQELKTHLFKGYIPRLPPFRPTDRIVTLGSCFAANIHDALHKRGIRSAHILQIEDTNSPLANRLLLEYALTDRPWSHPTHEQGFPAEIGRQLREILAECAGLVFTAGIAYCPFIGDELVTDYVANTQTPGLRWRLTSFEENVAHLKAIISTLRSFRPGLKIVLTVSPVPIARSFTHTSPLVADCVSKSTLRAAVEQVLQPNDPDLFYWPSFEAIRWLGGHIGPFFGVDGEDQRHPGAQYIEAVVTPFADAFFEGSGPR
jgi:hypothetical protein